MVAATAPGNMQDVEHAYLTVLGAPLGGQLNDRWFAVFAEPLMTWNDAAIAWLTGQGMTPPNLPQMWKEYWETP
jgi:hypothetical protein